MIFKLSVSKKSYSIEGDKDWIKDLTLLGFTFNPIASKTYSFLNYPGQIYLEGNPEIEINTLEELLEFQNKFGDIILHKIDDDPKLGLEIYNYYRE